ncbi:MAG: hypothetical protein HY602_02930 [Parcubacteria group bacterium]|nr:hypothetical protein [Parcubacteria group bacterium]
MNLLYQNVLISLNDIQQLNQRLAPYLEHLQKVTQTNDYVFNESSINLPFDKQLLNAVIKTKKQKISKRLKYILVIGIGGSNLGTKAIYDALYGYKDALEPKRFPKIFFLDTNSPQYLSALGNFLSKNIKSPQNILINAISKTGATTETIANLEFILKTLEGLPQFKDFNALADRLVITTDPSSKLAKICEEKRIAALPIPPIVGGRYSVMSPVGLFPLAACGADIARLLEGAQKMRDLCLAPDLAKNPSMLSAAILYSHYQNGKNINDNFCFHPELESLGKWYRQLMGECLGKEKDLDGNTVNVGITPTVSIGSTDLHSMGQLYLGGPKDKITTFVWSRLETTKPAVPAKLYFPDLIDHIEGKNMRQITEAIYEGTKLAYAKKELPFMEIILNGLDEYSLGEFLQFKMIEIMLLGNLLNINAFDQPNVDLYKTETKKILTQI